MVKVSTIIPAYNAERTIAQAIDSALSQDCEGHEVVVVNDGSTDSTAAILRSTAAQIRVITCAMAVQARRETQAFATRLADTWHFSMLTTYGCPEKLKTMVSCAGAESLASLAFSEYRYIDEQRSGMRRVIDRPCAFNGRTDDTPRPPDSSKHMGDPSTDVGAHRWILAKNSTELGLEDLWMLLLLRELGEFVYVPESLTLYRVGDSGALADKYAPGLPRLHCFGKTALRPERQSGGFAARKILNVDRCFPRWPIR